MHSVVKTNTTAIMRRQAGASENVHVLLDTRTHGVNTRLAGRQDLLATHEEVKRIGTWVFKRIA
jgi:hypothetical protein